MGLFDDAARRAGFALDTDQKRVAARLSRLADEVARRRPRHPEGVYLWGPVGRGKTWLAGALFDAVDVRHKRRLHFHEFLRDFHAAYARHRHRPGTADLAVAELLGRTRLLCFDEFHVHDPGDAMLVGLLTRALVDRRVALLATSNYPPSQLLPNPLYHHLFESTIALIERSLDVVELAGPTDYRAQARAPRSTFECGDYLWPGDDAQLLAVGVAPLGAGEASELAVSGRALRAEAVRDGLVWFDFARLCDAPTSTVDYLAVAERFPTWVISGLTRVDSRDAAQRFANVVDVLCDRDVRLVLVGDAPLRDLFPEGVAPVDFARTASRLALLRHHLPSIPPRGMVEV